MGLSKVKNAENLKSDEASRTLSTSLTKTDTKKLFNFLTPNDKTQDNSDSASSNNSPQVKKTEQVPTLVKQSISEKPKPKLVKTGSRRSVMGLPTPEGSKKKRRGSFNLF